MYRLANIGTLENNTDLFQKMRVALNHQNAPIPCVRPQYVDQQLLMVHISVTIYSIKTLIKSS